MNKILKKISSFNFINMFLKGTNLRAKVEKCALHPLLNLERTQKGVGLTVFYSLFTVSLMFQTREQGRSHPPASMG